MKVIVSNIQRFCLHDGPGLRTTVFLKGCSLKCPWCTNPENISFEIEEYTKDGLTGAYGKEYSLDELEKEILKDKDFYGNDGGVTFSGGEALLQFEKIEPLLKNLKEQNINICVETALNVPRKFVKIALKYVDEFLVDIKIIDRTAEEIIGSNSNLYINNLNIIIANSKNVTLRMPVIPKYTYTSENIAKIINVLKKIKVKNLQIFKIHRLGEQKYETLGLKMPFFEDISEKDLQNLKLTLSKYVDNVEIISF